MAGALRGPCFIMHADETDQEQIDLLVRELMTRRPMPPTSPPPARTPAGNPPTVNANALAAPPAPPPPSVATPVDPQPGERRAGRAWSNVRLLMPSMRRSDQARHIPVELASALRLPPVPTLSRFIRPPGPVAQVRMWVGLGVVYAASLSFWPYPRTYLWGLVLYILSLGVVLVSGVWGARLSWEARLGAAHTVSLGTVLWAVKLAAVETLPPG